MFRGGRRRTLIWSQLTDRPIAAETQIDNESYYRCLTCSWEGNGGVAMTLPFPPVVNRILESGSTSHRFNMRTMTTEVARRKIGSGERLKNFKR